MCKRENKLGTPKTYVNAVESQTLKGPKETFNLPKVEIRYTHIILYNFITLWWLTLCPEFDGAQGQPEALLVGDEAEDGVRHAAAIEAPDTLGVEVL